MAAKRKKRRVALLKRLTVASLEPGDVLLLETEENLSQEWSDRIQAQVQKRLPAVQVLVLYRLKARAILRSELLRGKLWEQALTRKPGK